MSEPTLNENFKDADGKWTRRKDCKTHPCAAQESIDAAQRIREWMLTAEIPNQIRTDIGLAGRVLDAWFDCHRTDL